MRTLCAPLCGSVYLWVGETSTEVLLQDTPFASPPFTSQIYGDNLFYESIDNFCGTDL